MPVCRGLKIREAGFEIQLTPEFHRECLLASVPYDVTIAAYLSAERATMDLYIILEGYAQEVREYPEFTHELQLRGLMPMPEHDNKARQAMFRRLEAISTRLSGVFVAMTARGTGVLVDIGRPKRNSRRGGERVGWYLRDQVSRSTHRMPPALRRVMGEMVRQMEAWEGVEQ